jgi:hypothetical protein
MMQAIVIRHDGIEYEAWRHTKNGYEENSEREGCPLNLHCELAHKPMSRGCMTETATRFDAGFADRAMSQLHRIATDRFRRNDREPAGRLIRRQG